MRNTLSLTVLPLLAGYVAAQLPSPVSVLRDAPRAVWARVQTSPANEIPQRADAPGAASSSLVYVFGGCSGNNTSTTLNDLWQFDGANATQLSPVNAAPHARGRHACAWNAATNKLVVFGGNNRAVGPLPADTLLNDIWEYDPALNTWTDVTPTSGPAPTPRQHAAMAFDPQTGGMLVFGGQDSLTPTFSSETWLFLGGAWIPMSPTTVPPARSQASLCTRPDFNDVFLCGGIDGTSATDPRKLDAWSWSGANWTMLNPGLPGVTSFPGSVNANQAVYDPLRKRVVMHGGQGIGAGTGSLYTTALGNEYGGSPSQYTNEFDCFTNDWTLYANPQGMSGTTFECNRDGADSNGQLGRNSRYAAAFLPTTGKIYKLCGQRPNYPNSNPQYIFEYQASPVATTTTLGAGCNSSAGPMALVADNDPWSSRSWQLTGSGFAAGALGAAVIGFGSQSLPLSNLHPAGGAGCDVLVTQDAVLLVVPSGGQAILSLSLPNTPVFAGLGLNTQMFCVEFTGSGTITRISSTNGVRGTIGAL